MKRRTTGQVLFDVLMTMLTGGAWLIWIFIRTVSGR